MKAYVVATGIIFALITVAHALRIAQEGSRLAKEPAYMLLTLTSTGLALWAGWLLSRKSRTTGRDRGPSS